MGKTILGLDLGSNSIGWALLLADDQKSPQEIIDLGVRNFPKAVEEKTPTPKNQKRRNMRLARRTIQRRAQRKKKLLNFLVSLQLLPKALIDSLQPEGILNSLGNPYTLRAKALDEKLSTHELGRVLLHLVQRRGFLSNKKTLLGRDMLDDPDVIAILHEEEDQQENHDAEETAFKADINQLRQKITENGFRTLGEYLASKPIHECRRNRREENIRTDRQMYQEELALILAKQVNYHSILTEQIQSQIKSIIFHQRPLKLKQDRVGKCSLEPKKKRAAIARLEYQKFRYLQDINILTYFDDYTEEDRKLTEEDREELIQLFETTAAPTFTQIRKILGLDKKTRFNLETHVKRLKGNTTAVTICKVYPGWEELSDEKKLHFVDDLLSIKKKSTLKNRLMNYWKLDGATAVKVCLIELEPDYGHVSLKAIKKLLPHLQNGHIYSEARIAAGYSYVKQDSTPQNKLSAPPETPNPIVNKGLHELRRVINALIAEYGKPDIIRIEMARDLEMNTKRHKRFSEQQTRNTKANEKASAAYQQIAQEHPQLQLSKYPSRDQKIRYRLWQDQGHNCIYSGKSINLKTLFSAEVEVDHILPYSQSLDDSYMNKVVCFAQENQNKGQKTPIDAFGAQTEKWEQITQAISRWPKEFSKKRSHFYKREDDLLETDFIGNQLTDTRYICKEAGNYLKSLGADVTFTRGIMTDWLRHQWDLNTLIGVSTDKDRTDHRHHTVDAVVTACIDRSLYTSLCQQAKALEHSKSQLSMKDIYITPPLNNIREILEHRLKDLIVAHTPQKKISGALHEETGVGFIEGIGTVYRQVLDKDFDSKKVEKIIDPETKHLVQTHLEKHGNNPKKAFAPDVKLFHKDGATPIKRVRIIQSKTTYKKLTLSKFPILDKYGKAFKWHAFGNVHHVQILQNKKTGKYKSQTTSMLEAAQRVRGISGKAQPLYQAHPPEGWVHVMTLHINDLVALTIEGNEYIYRVQKFNMIDSKIALRLHTAATIKNKNEGIEKSPNTLMATYAMKKIRVNAIGKVCDD